MCVTAPRRTTTKLDAKSGSEPGQNVVVGSAEKRIVVASAASLLRVVGPIELTEARAGPDTATAPELEIETV